MICTECKKHTTSIVNEKYDKKNNLVKRNRYCVCGNSFETYEKIKKSVKRKPREASEWKNCRIALYAVQRLADCLPPMVKEKNKFTDRFFHFFKDVNLEKYKNKTELRKTLEKMDLEASADELSKSFVLGTTKEGGKNYFKLPIDEEVHKLVSHKDLKKIKFVSKRETINRIVADKHYWTARYIFLGKPVEDIENKSIVRKESQEYYKSVCDYIKQPQYNKDFFIQHQPPMKDMWNMWWDLYLKIR